MPLTQIMNIFGQSPIRPLQSHMRQVSLCVDKLIPFFTAVFAKDFAKAASIHNEIVTLENEADTIKKDLRLHLPKSLFLPVSRSDLLSMLTTQDMIANKAKDIAGLVFGRKTQFPEPLCQPFMALLQRSIDATHQAHNAINELDELLEVGFRGREVSLVEKMIVELDLIETNTDDMQAALRQILFKLEQDLAPVEVIFLYKIIEWIGDLADIAHGVGGQLQLLLAH